MNRNQVLLLSVLAIPVILFGVLYYQMNSIDIYLTASEQQIVSWFGSIIRGQTPDFKLILHFQNPTFFAVDISDIIIHVYIEDEYQFQTTIDQLYIPAGQNMVREVEISLSNLIGLSSRISQAILNYAGEVKISISGSARAHILFLSTRLSFDSTDYYYFSDGKLAFSDAYWVDQTGNEISSALLGNTVAVKIVVFNPRRSGSLSGSISVQIRLDVDFWFDEDMGTSSDQIIVQPGKFGSTTFSFSPPERAWYHFDVYLDNNHVYVQPNSSPPRLSVQ